MSGARSLCIPYTARNVIALDARFVGLFIFVEPFKCRTINGLGNVQPLALLAIDLNILADPREFGYEKPIGG